MIHSRNIHLLRAGIEVEVVFNWGWILQGESNGRKQGQGIGELQEIDYNDGP